MGGAARLLRVGAGRLLGGAVPHHAAQARGDPAARRGQRDRPLRRGGQHRRGHRRRPPGRRQHGYPGMVAALREGASTRWRPPPSSARAPPPPPPSPRWPGSARARSPRSYGARRGRRRCAAGASVSASRCTPPPGRRRCTPSTCRSSSRRPRRAPPTPSPRTYRSAPEPSSTCCTTLWPTPLAAAWAEGGGRVVGGLDLLVHQAVLQVEQMTGRAPAPLAAMRAAGEEALATR